MVTLWTKPTVEELEKVVGKEFKSWAFNCHGISLAIVQSGILNVPCRVARGSCIGVLGQHSWIILGDDCYSKKAEIVDPTLWSYDSSVEGVWYGKNLVRHRPHGLGTIWRAGKPSSHGGPVIELTGKNQLSQRSQDFLALLGPLDMQGWIELLHSPVEGWPSAEIIEAAYNTKELKAFIPIDIVGMLTRINPQGLYF